MGWLAGKVTEIQQCGRKPTNCHKCNERRPESLELRRMKCISISVAGSLLQTAPISQPALFHM